MVLQRNLRSRTAVESTAVKVSGGGGLSALLSVRVSAASAGDHGIESGSTRSGTSAGLMTI